MPARTTIRMDERLLREAKKQAAEEGRSLTSVIEDALRASLGPRRRPERAKPVKLTTAGKGGLRPSFQGRTASQILALQDGEHFRAKLKREHDPR